MPFSKALLSTAFVGLIILSSITFFQNRKLPFTIPLLLFPIILFSTLVISLFYSTDFVKGLDILFSQIEFVAIPFIFLVNQIAIRKRLLIYSKLLIDATTIAAFITFLFFLLPIDITQNIATTVPLLKDYIVHEKTLAFGVYSPFTERLQFSYLIGITIFLQLWLFFEKSASKTSSSGSTLFPSIPISDTSRVSDTFFNFKSSLKIIILFTTLLILGARGAQLSFLVASITWIIGGYFYWIHPIVSKKINAFFGYIFLIIGLTFFLLIVPFIAYQKIPTVKVRYDQMRWEIGTFQDGTFNNYEYIHFTSIRRLLSWKNSWSIIQENPILGVGIGDYQAAMEKAYTTDNLGFPVNTQSQFLYYWTASGLLSLFIFLSFLGYSLFTFFRQKDFGLKLVGISFLVFYILLFLFDAPLNFQVGAMTFLTIFCLLSIRINDSSPNLIHSI